MKRIESGLSVQGWRKRYNFEEMWFELGTEDWEKDDYRVSEMSEFLSRERQTDKARQEMP